MYTSFFKLSCKPFQLTPDPEFLFLSKVHQRAITYLSYGMGDTDTGFVLITGEVGTGKTTIIKSAMSTLDEDITLARIDNTKVSSNQLMAMINEDFGLDTEGKGTSQLVQELSAFIINEYALGKRSVLIIDEAQNLTSDLLEEVRLLSNLETDKVKLLRIILVGQPELRKKLARPELRQLRQRISVSCHIQPLTREEIEEYILHRLQVAGNRKAVSFEKGALDVIHHFSRGVPRLVNTLCDFILLSAFQEKTTVITGRLAGELAEHIEGENGYWHDEKVSEGCQGGGEKIKEILNRLDRLEVDAYKWNSIKSERKDIHARLLATEALLISGFMDLKAVLADRDDSAGKEQLANILQEIQELKEKVVSFEKRYTPFSRSRARKSFWARVFSRYDARCT